MSDHLFKPNPKRSVIIRTSDKYYVLRFPCGREIGGPDKAALARYSRGEGFTPDYTDERPKPMKIGHGL